MKRVTTAGVCQICQGVVAKGAMTRHLAKCLASEAAATTAPAKGKPKRGKLFHLLAQGKYNPQYWLHVEVPADATLADLDEFLRHIWLECCGHLSMFTIQGRRYSIDAGGDGPFGWDEPEPGMDVPVGEVLRPGLKLSHEYDFGSTTYLDLKVLGEREGPLPGKGGVRLLARNVPPETPCGKCGRPAVLVDTQAESEEDFWLCRKCAPRGDDDYLLPAVNSPRVGVCGYTG